MQKKLALVFLGSPRKNGQTRTALAFLQKELKNEYDFATIDSYKQAIAPCTACEICARTGRCFMRDFDDIDAKIQCADLVIVATPGYWGSFPAPLKAIVDRLQTFFWAKVKNGGVSSVKKTKKAVSILAFGEPAELTYPFFAEQLRLMYGVLNARLVGEIILDRTDGGFSAEDAQAQAKRIAELIND